MPRGDLQRIQKIRIAIRYLLKHDALTWGDQTRLAEHFNVSRQHVNKLVHDERRGMRVERRPEWVTQDSVAAGR